jgi:hypothetical protein
LPSWWLDVFADVHGLETSTVVYSRFDIKLMEMKK